MISFAEQQRDPPALLHKEDKKNAWFKVQPDLNIDADGVAKWKEFAMGTSNGTVTAATIRNGVIH